MIVAAFKWSKTRYGKKKEKEKWYRPFRKCWHAEMRFKHPGFIFSANILDSGNRSRLAISAVVTCICKADVTEKKRKHKSQSDGSGTALSAQRDGGRRLNRPERKKARFKVANIVSAIFAIHKATRILLHSFLSVSVVWLIVFGWISSRKPFG